MDSEGGIVFMKGICRVISLFLTLVMLLVPLAALGEQTALSPAARLIVTASALTPSGETMYYGPAVPVSDAPDENRLWLKVPLEVLFSGRIALLVEDTVLEYASIQPASGSVLENISDAGMDLSIPSVTIECFDEAGTLIASFLLYVSSQDAPAPETPVEQPTEPPVETPVFPTEVTVRYLNEAGEPIAAETVCPVQPGSNTVYPSAEIPEEYELTDIGAKEVFVDADGINPPVVEFHYALKEISASVQIHFTDTEGNPIADSLPFNLDGGEHPVQAPAIEGYIPVEPSLQYIFVDRNGANPPEITFQYERAVQPANVTIHYTNQNGEALRDDDVLPFSKGIHNATAVVIPGYTLVGEAEQPVMVDENGATPAEITFLYQRELIPTNILVHYVDENGSAIAADTEQTINPPGGVVLPMSGLSPEEYELISPESVEVTLSEDGPSPAEVTFQYRRIIHPANVLLHYVDDQGNTIAEDSVVSVPGGDSEVFPQAEIDPALYALMDPAFYTVTVTPEGASAQELTFTYRRLVQPVTVTIHYVDERGEAIAPDDQAVFGEGVHEILPAAEISEEDYIFVGPASHSLTVTLEGASENDFTFAYQRTVKPAQVTVHYVNEAGEPVAEDTFLMLEAGSQVVFPQANPEKYSLADEAEPLQNVIVDADGAHPAEVTFVYKPLSSEPVNIPVLFVDQDTNVEIALRRNVAAMPGTVTEVSALPAPEDLLPNYLLTSEPTVSVTVDNAGVSSVQEVVFSYLYVPKDTEEPTATPEPTAEPEPSAEPTDEATQEPADLAPTEEPTEEPAQAQAATVTVHYIDTEGQPIAMDSLKYCNVGNTVITATPEDLPEGYVLDGSQDEGVLVQVDENGADPEEITFVYRYIPEASEPKMALVNVKYVDPDDNVFLSDAVMCFEGQDNIISINWEEVDPSLGYVLESSDTVHVTVDSECVATPAEVVFKFRNELSVTVPVYYRDQITGQDVASSHEQQCFPGANTIDANPLNLEEGYILSGSGSVTVTLNEDGTLTPAEVVFQYWREATEAPVPTAAPYDEPMDAFFYPTGSPVNVRSSTSTVENNILGTVNSNDLGHIVGKLTTREGRVWYSVEIKGMVGYMSEGVVRFLNDAELMALYGYTPAPTAVPTPLPTEVPTGAVIDRWGETTAKVRFRRTPDKNGSVVDELHKNSRIWIYSYEETNGEKWYAINYYGKTGYMMAKFVNLLSEAESEQIQRSLASPMPTQEPPATPVPTVAPTPEPTQVPTPEPTEEPTPVPPTEAPVETATPEPSETPVPYRGYALTTSQAALRTGVSQTDDTILQTLPAKTLLDVKAETYVDGVSWAYAQAVGSENWGYIPMSSLTPISNDEAKFYRDQIFTTPEVTASPMPQQVEGYAMTVGAGVPMRNYPDTKGEIITLLPYPAVAYVFGQEYADDAWHVVQYNGIWGFIRQDQLRMMGQDEVAAYEESLVDSTPSPSPAPTPEPMTENSLSSYGYAIARSGKVNLRSEASVSSTALRLLDNYAFSLVLGTETNDEGTWYHVSQAGTEGYIRSDYFYVLPLNELSDFLQSEEYLNANSNNASGGATSSEIQPVEDFNRNVLWQNPSVMPSYEPFNPFATVTPAPELTLPTGTPAPTETPAPSATPQIAPVGPTEGNLPEPNVRQGGSAWPWVLLALAVVGGGGAYYAFTVNSQNKKRAALRAQQARQARSQVAAHPQMRAAQNNPAPAEKPASQAANRPAQTAKPAAPAVNRPAYPSQKADLAYLPPKSASQKPGQGPDVLAFKPLIPSDKRPPEAGGTKNFVPIRGQNPTQVYQRPQPTAKETQPAGGTAQWKPISPDAEKSASAPVKAPEQTAKPSDTATSQRRVRRTERNKDLYGPNDKA